MTMSMYEASVPVFRKRLEALAAILTAAQTDAAARKFDPQVLLNARLAPDMLNLTKQVQIATDHAKGAPTRLTGRAPVPFDDNETTIDELKARLTRTDELLASFRPEEFEGSEARKIEFKIGKLELSLSGQDYLLHFALPNFYFHITTAYNILRHNGVSLGKRDFLAGLPQG